MENRRHWKGRCASDWRGVCACTVCVEQNLRREREIHVVPLCGYMNFGVDVAKNRATKYLRYLRYCERLQSLGKTCAVRGLAADRATVARNIRKTTIPFWFFLLLFLSWSRHLWRCDYALLRKMVALVEKLKWRNLWSLQYWTISISINMGQNVFFKKKINMAQDIIPEGYKPTTLL